MTTLPPTANLRAFEAVARRRSFSLAAAELHLTASAISHQVSKLEAQLGVRLFERSAHGVRLSPAGEQYLARVGGALSALMAATEDLRQGTSNSLYVHSAPSLASLWLMPRLRAFAQACPDIALNLSAAHTHSDFALGLVDIDIRYGVPQWPDLVVEPLFEERILPLASRSFVREHRLKRPEQLLALPLIQSNVSVIQWSDWFSAFTTLRAPNHFGVRFDRAQMFARRRHPKAWAWHWKAPPTLPATWPGRTWCPCSTRQCRSWPRCISRFTRPGTLADPPVETFLAWLHGEAAKT